MNLLHRNRPGVAFQRMRDAIDMLEGRTKGNGAILIHLDQQPGDNGLGVQVISNMPESVQLDVLMALTSQMAQRALDESGDSLTQEILKLLGIDGLGLEEPEAADTVPDRMRDGADAVERMLRGRGVGSGDQPDPADENAATHAEGSGIRVTHRVHEEGHDAYASFEDAVARAREDGLGVMVVTWDPDTHAGASYTNLPDDVRSQILSDAQKAYTLPVT